MRSDPLVRVRGLGKTYGDGAHASRVLNAIDLDLHRAEMAALLGPSGSGKSTLLTILGTLLRQTDGEHCMLGEDLGNASDKERTRFRNKHLGFVFQFHHLLPDLTALENVMMPSAVAHGSETGAMRRRAAELLDAVALADRSKHRPAELSGGQRQRVAVARALMNAPSLVLADEPTGNLDRSSADQVMALLEKINRDTGTAFLISTHDERIAMRCSRKINLLDGTLVTEGP